MYHANTGIYFKGWVTILWEQGVRDCLEYIKEKEKRELDEADLIRREK